jgi:fructokinase
MTKKVLAFGEILWDLLPSGPVLGGAPLNFAYRIHMLGDEAWIASRLGKDPLGQKAAEQVSAFGMDLRLVQWDEAHPTGTVPIQLDASGSPDFTILPDVAYDYIEPAQSLLEMAAKADCICYGILVQRTGVSRQTLRAVLDAGDKALKVLDVNLRKKCYSRETLSESIASSDVLKLNDAEVPMVRRLLGYSSISIYDFVRWAPVHWSLQHCVVTLGSRGAIAASRNGPVHYEPGFRVEVTDTCGAGDAFTAGFVHGLLRGDSLGESCRIGSALGALVAGKKGGTSLVSRGEIQSFLAANPERVVDDTLSRQCTATS